MDTIEELLPGLEAFLTTTLASEKLSNFAEERRQFFIERLDIIKLPPSLPPREGRVLSPELLKEAEEINGTPVIHNPTTDFAATQREISRSFVDTNILTEDAVDLAETSLEKHVKVYDDIDSWDSKEQTHVNRPSSLSDMRPNECCDEDDNNEGNAFYEIPVARLQLSPDGDSQSIGADGSNITTVESTEDLQDDVLDSTLVPPTSIPPPLPPRREIRFSDSGSRNSINFDDKPPELPFRPALPKRNELYIRSDKSDHSEKSNNSDPELSVDGDSTSYESFEEGDQPDTDLINKLSIQLPKKPKKRMGLKKNNKLSKSRSSSQWEISAPFRKLENIDISGELYYKGKLKWNRRIVAVSNGCLAMYKPDKEARPSLVIPLSGYEANINEREGRRGFEVKMSHPNADSHTFSVDFKEWALLWIEHINGTSKGQTPPKYHTHLARSFSGDGDCGAVATSYGSKTDLNESSSNLSTGSEGGSEDSSKTKIRGSKVMRMGSFAFRATQFFENIGKKTTHKKKSHHGSLSNFRYSGDFTDVRDGIIEETPISISSSAGNLARNRKTSSSDSNSSSALTKAENTLPAHLEAIDHEDLVHVTHKGYLLIFSSFNKRCWGKRWCLVRQNMFECYKSDSSKQYELNFLLKPCILRRAVTETNSENGLMIMDAGREKITVEPVSKEEMGKWVQVFLHETSTPNIPEGLEEYMKEPTHSDGDSISVVSFSVLKQWDMDCLVPTKNPSSHDYEDPADTADAAARLHAQNIAESEVSVHTNTVFHQDVLMSEHVNQIQDSLPVHQKNKHTTDSGFYSAKGTNSDSDSCHETCDLNLGLANKNSDMLRSTQHPITFEKVTSLSFTQKKFDGNKNTSLAKIGSHGNCIQCSRLSAPSHCACLSHSSPSLPSAIANSKPSGMAASESHLQMCSSTPVFQYTGGKISECDSQHPSNNIDWTETDNSLNTNLNVLSPDGEKYSIVLKRSERSFKSSKSYNELKQATINMKCEYDSNNSYNDDAKFANNVNEVQKCSLATCDNETSYYEPICAQGYTASTSEDDNLNKFSSNNSASLKTTSGSKGFDYPAPITTSSITHPGFTFPHADTTTSSKSETHIFEQSDISSEPRKTSAVCGSNTVNSEENVNRNASLSALMCMPASKGEMSTSEKGSFVGADHSLIYQMPITSDVIALINSPDTSVNELKNMVECLKCQLSEIKRNRLVVHEKHQSMLNVDDKIVCEKELAKLERTANDVEHDIKIIQNYLDYVQVHPSETKKTTHGKHKSKSKFKKLKKISKASSG